jgi:hypothetical protein
MKFYDIPLWGSVGFLFNTAHKVSQYSALLKATIWTDGRRITIKLKEDEIWMTDLLK